MELLDRFWPASRQLAKCGLASFGPDLSQSGNRRTEACPGDRSDESPRESQWWKFKNTVYTTTIIIYSYSFLKMCICCWNQIRSDILCIFSRRDHCLSIFLSPLSSRCELTVNIYHHFTPAHPLTDQVLWPCLLSNATNLARSEVDQHGWSSDGRQTIRNYWF